MKKLVFILSAMCLTAMVQSQPGTIDLTFNAANGPNDYVNTIAVQPDGKILVGGAFTSFNGVSRGYIVRLNADGSIDDTFISGTGFNSIIMKIIIQPDGKIIVGGGFTSYNGIACKAIARLNTDGLIDDSFAPQIDKITGSSSSSVTAIVRQNDGKIVISGSFMTTAGTQMFNLARLNANGSIDSGFDAGLAWNGGRADDIVIQNDGKIIITGTFVAIGATQRNRIARLNINGSIDTGFDPGSGFSGINQFVTALKLQPDEKILVGGYFGDYNGANVLCLVRLNNNGSLDTDFSSISRPNDFVEDIALQNDGKIVIVGRFLSYNGTGRNRIARLNSNGTLDAGFSHVSGASSIVYTVALQNDGKILIGGYFTSYNGTSRIRIARINGTPSTNIFDPQDEQTKCRVFPNPVYSELYVAIENNDSFSYEILNHRGQLQSSSNNTENHLINVSQLQPGVYVIKIRNNEQTFFRKFIKI